MKRHQSFLYFVFFTITSFFSDVALCQVQSDSLPSYVGEEVLFVGRRIYNYERLTIENSAFKKLPATFDDPSRLLLKYPGFSNDNDQANGIVYHGLPLHYNNWQLNGLEIVNPNHLSNAGTFSDLSSATAGGVNMFSGNIINKFSFHSAFDKNRCSPILGGSADLQLGAPSRSFAQLSLLGIETGWRNSEKNKHQIYGNLRYSFTGLLDDLGVSFGDESIRFADAVMGYNHNGSKSKTSIVIAAGWSSNIHEVQDSVTVLKDLFDIRYKGRAIIAHASHQYSLNNGHVIDFSAAYSSRQDTRNLVYVIDPFSVTKQDFSYHHQILSLHQSYRLPQNEWVFGIKEWYNNNDLVFKKNAFWSFLPYIQKDFTLTPSLSIESRIEGYIQSAFAFNPHIKIAYLHNDFSCSVIANKSSQALLLFEKNISLANALNLGINFTKQWKNINAQVNFFGHKINNIGRSNNEYTLFNAYDYFQSIIAYDVTAVSKGADVMVEYYAPQNWWVNANATFFNATYHKENGDTRNGENNFGKVLNFNIGKDFIRSQYKWSVSASYHYRGGQYAFNVIPIIFNQKDYSTPPNVLLSPYSRLDFRVNLTAPNYFISLDIQNITNQLNDAYLSFDLDGAQVRSQLGLLPVLSYKRFF